MGMAKVAAANSITTWGWCHSVPSDGGIKPCVSSFGADQFDDSDAGKRRRKSSFFNWFYFSINVGALVASSVLVYVQTHVRWGMGLRHPRHRHRRRRDIFPGRAALQATGIQQVLVVSGDALYSPLDSTEGSRKLGHTEQFRFLDIGLVRFSQKS
ncbi:hypothetical protein QYE76_046905 [Lolium multiflorum]|uniref:Uncharacterized protein n=1 Tax=Lolium multiflorum TaxID=4521 RepID=A0AAD8WYS8_LOLMU|nr:hypothetical protein QYE76_046905 [Lolium multiflorum]